MKEFIENEKFNRKLETSEWRYSAAILGLKRYFDFLVQIGEDLESNLYFIEDDTIYYQAESITQERYLQFVESYFQECMHHLVIEEILSNHEFSNEQIKLVNEKLKANAIMKKVFSEVKFDGKNKKEILREISQNRLNIIKETYRTGKSLYANFANVNSLFTENNDICRLENYCIDTGKKSKSISYNWNFKTYSYEDEIEFDFIPFAFSKSYESFFINNNYSIHQLNSTNTRIANEDNAGSKLFETIKTSADFIDYDVEVIVKRRDKSYFESLYIRKSAIQILKELKNYNAIKFSYKVNENYYINFEKEIINAILNKIKIDAYIEILLKDGSTRYAYNIGQLIRVNILIYEKGRGECKMDEKMKSAYACAKQVAKKLPDNKMNSYKQKLISAIIFKDQDRFCQILIQLSSYSGIVFNFAYDLFGKDDFENNKNIAYTFINALNKDEENGGKKNEK